MSIDYEKRRYYEVSVIIIIDPVKEHKIFSVAFAKIYDCYGEQAERKQRIKEEVDTVIC